MYVLVRTNLRVSHHITDIAQGVSPSCGISCKFASQIVSRHGLAFIPVFAPIELNLTLFFQMDEPEN
jgi:hypothetical protein